MEIFHSFCTWSCTTQIGASVGTAQGVSTPHPSHGRGAKGQQIHSDAKKIPCLLKLSLLRLRKWESPPTWDISRRGTDPAGLTASQKHLPSRQCGCSLKHWDLREKWLEDRKVLACPSLA